MKHIILCFFVCFAIQLLPSSLANVQAQRQQLVKQRADLAKAKDELSKIYTDLKTQLIDQINDVRNNTLAKQTSDIKDAKNSVNQLPQVVLSAITIGDLPSAIDSIANTLTFIDQILANVVNLFSPTIAKLDPESDPLGVYKNIAEALSNMDGAITEIKKLEQLLSDLGDL